MIFPPATAEVNQQMLIWSHYDGKYEIYMLIYVTLWRPALHEVNSVTLLQNYWDY